MTVGERLKYLRKRKGVSQQELSSQLGINRSTYARYETDDNQADYETLHKLADFFGTSIDYLLGRTDEPDVLSPVRDGADVQASPQSYDVARNDLQQLIRESRTLTFGGDQMDLDDEERRELLRHMRHAWLMIKEKREEKAWEQQPFKKE